MASSPDRYFAGFSTLEAGMNGGISPSLIGKNQVAASVNVTYRGGFATTRPGFSRYPLTLQGTAITHWTGRWQGSCRYETPSRNGWVVSRGGRLFFLEDSTWIVTEVTPILFSVTTAAFTVPAINGSVTIAVNSETPFAIGQTVFIDGGSYTITVVFTNGITATYNGGASHATAPAGAAISNSTAQISSYQTNPASLDFVYLFQAENYVIVLAGNNPTIIFDGSSSRRSMIKEVPPGFLGVYGWGRIWICLPDRISFVAGDLIRGASGTPQNGYRDAILKFTENDVINTGGAFGVPANAGLITSMQFLATQDTSLGVGVLLVGTTNMVFSVNAPVDRTVWKSLSYPIQTISLLDYGPLSPNGSVSVNGDMWYRSQDGFRSFIVARRNFGRPGNTPLSREISPIIEKDSDNLLFYNSGIRWDNKLYETVSPFRTLDGVLHQGLAVINYDLISNLQGNSSAAWEGANTGLSIFQITKGNIHGTERAFAFVSNVNGLEFWELMRAKDSTLDQYNLPESQPPIRNPISSWLETRAEDFTLPITLKLLYMAAFYIDDIVDSVSFTVKYKPDQYPEWILWQTFTVCAKVSQCTIPGVAVPCVTWQPNARLYAARVTIGQPQDTCVPGMIISQPPRLGHEFQFRLEWTGHCRIRKFEPQVKPQTQPTEGDCPGIIPCAILQDCGTKWFDYVSVPGPIPPPPPPIPEGEGICPILDEFNVWLDGAPVLCP